MDTKMTTLCYIEKDGAYLMLHRTKKEKDINLTNDLLRQSNSSKEEYILKTRGDSDSLKYDIKRHKQKVTMSLMLILSWILTMLCVLGGLIWFVVAKSH